MHANGGRGLVREVASPAAGESRRVRHPAALGHRRPSGGIGLIAGAGGESLKAISALGSMRVSTTYGRRAKLKSRVYCILC